MEGKKPTGSSSSSSSSSLASELFGRKDSAGKNSSSSSGLFNSVFPPVSSVMGRDSSRPDIFGPSRKQERTTAHAWNAQNDFAGGNRQNSPGKGVKKDHNSIYNGEKIDTCFLGSSLYYGGQDICDTYTQPRSSQTSGSGSGSGSSYNYKKDAEDSGDSCIDSRGNWWEGSLYY